jgi:hypothetical protein
MKVNRVMVTLLLTALTTAKAPIGYDLDGEPMQATLS